MFGETLGKFGVARAKKPKLGATLASPHIRLRKRNPQLRIYK